MESQDMTEGENEDNKIAFRDGSLFIIDTSPEMFESDNSQPSYFAQCLETCTRILSQKLTWNRRDWMGLILYNTKLQDNPEIEHIYTMQKFAEVSTEMLVNLLYILEHEEDHYKNNAVSSDKSLHDSLWHACRSFDSVKIAMSLRQVVLLTCRDNPLSENETERHKIRLRAKTYRDINVKLRVIGLGEEWNDKLFYKDILVLASDANPDDVKRIQLDDLEVQIGFPARISGRMKLKFGNDLEIPIFITSFSCKTKYLKKARMHKETNEVLDVVRHWGPSRELGDDSEDEGDEPMIKTHVPDTIQKGIRCGGKLICFQLPEVREIRVTRKPGINLIGFQPIRLDLHYHIKATKFVGIEDSTSKEEKAFFAALLNECETQSLMAVCAVSHRSAPYLAKMLPCSEYGGFYLYKIAFREQINGLGEYTKSYIHAELPIDEEGIELMKKIIKRIQMHWQPQKFTNPKLVAELAYVEALALDREVSEPVDSTLPDKSVIVQRISKWIDKYDQKFPSTSSHAGKRPSFLLSDEELQKAVKFQTDVIEEMVKNGTLSRLLATTLKCFARSLGMPSSGTKAELIKRITDYYTLDGS